MSAEQIKPGYKRTEVGVIPEDWEVKALGDCLLGRPRYGINAPAVPFSDRLPAYIRITDITEHGRFVAEKPVSVDSAFAGSYYLNDGDIVFARTGASVGKSYRYVPDDGPLVFAGFLIQARPNPEVLSSAYAAAYVTTGAYWNWVRLMSMRSGQPGINGNEFSKLPVPIPSVAEQRAIATALSDVDALLAKLDQLIAKKRDLKQAAMQQLLTGQTRLPGFSGAWEVKRLRDVAELSPGINKPVSEMGSGVLYVTVQDLYNGTSIRIEGLGRIRVSEAELQSQALLEGDIVFGKSSVKRDGIGYPSIFLGALEPVVCTGFAYRARALPSQADARFLFYSLRCEPTRRWVIDNSQASALTNINKAIADAIPVSLPSVEEQTTIATVLSDMDTELAALETRRDKTRALKQGMMQELLTGRIRLISLGGKS